MSTSTHEIGARPSAVRAAAHPVLAGGLVALALGLALVSLLGPLVTGLVEYHVTETLLNQTIGLDAVSLLVVAPLAVLTAVLVARDHVAGPVLAIALGAYTTYMFLQYILGPDYLGLPGNNQILFPLYLALFTGGWAIALAGWNAADLERLPRSPRRDRVVGRFVLPALAFLVFFRYVPALADTMSADPQGAEYLAGPTFFWAIAMLDLGVFLPATVVACVGLARGAPWAHKALYAVVGWFALVGPAVAGMALTMYVNDDPNASGAGVVFMTALGLAFAVVAVVLLRPLFAREQR